MQMKRKHWVALSLALTLVAGCRSERPRPTPVPLPTTDNNLEGKVVGDDRSAMEAAVDSSGQAGAGPSSTPEAAAGGVAMAPGAPDTYVVQRGDTLWGIAKMYLRDPWFWPEIWQVNPQVQNPHRIYPGDTLRLVYIDGKPRVMVQRGPERGSGVHVVPRVRSEPLEAAITTIPFETVAAFMSKPSVLTREQIKAAGYILASRDEHSAIAEGNTIYARGFGAPVQVGVRYSVLRVGDALIDPDDRSILGYNGIYTGTGRVTRAGDPATLVVTDSARESEPGDKIMPASVDVALDFAPSPPRTRLDGRIIAVNDGVTTIGQYQVVVINRGARDGLVAGNVLAVFDAGALVPDDEKRGFLNSSNNRLFAKKVRLPDERTGTFMVFKTFDRLSYGLIMEAKDIIRVSDRVGNP